MLLSLLVELVLRLDVDSELDDKLLVDELSEDDWLLAVDVDDELMEDELRDDDSEDAVLVLDDDADD